MSQCANSDTRPCPTTQGLGAEGAKQFRATKEGFVFLVMVSLEQFSVV
jgi:hypothetical protein